jgi:hypothetical protein
MCRAGGSWTKFTAGRYGARPRDGGTVERRRLCAELLSNHSLALMKREQIEDRSTAMAMARYRLTGTNGSMQVLMEALAAAESAVSCAPSWGKAWFRNGSVLTRLQVGCGPYIKGDMAEGACFCFWQAYSLGENPETTMDSMRCAWMAYFDHHGKSVLAMLCFWIRQRLKSDSNLSDTFSSPIMASLLLPQRCEAWLALAMHCCIATSVAKMGNGSTSRGARRHRGRIRRDSHRQCVTKESCTTRVQALTLCGRSCSALT